MNPKIYIIFKQAIIDILSEVEKKLYYKFNELVTIFYNDYEPIHYVRFGNPLHKKDGLYNAFYINRDDHKFVPTFDTDLLPQHKQENSIVYTLNLKEGLHGGIQTVRGFYQPYTKPSVKTGLLSFWMKYKDSVEEFHEASCEPILIRSIDQAIQEKLNERRI